MSPKLGAVLHVSMPCSACTALCMSGIPDQQEAEK